MELKGIFDRFFSRRGDKIFRSEIPRATLAKMRLASHPDAKPESLMKLSRHDWEHIVARVAENNNTPAEVLSRLVEHVHPEVRIALTENRNTPQRVLILLAADPSTDVRYSLAENHNTPVAVLALLCEDENPYVADRARKSLNRLQQAERSPATGWFPQFRQQRRQSLG